MNLCNEFWRAAGGNYNAPALQSAFQAMASAPAFGGGLLSFCVQNAYPLLIDDSLRAEGISGTCSRLKIRILPESSYRDIVHEMRHGYQMRQLDVFWHALKNPMARHVMKRMVEADAFTHEDMASLERWVALDWRKAEDVPGTEPDAPRALGILESYARNAGNPQTTAQIMRDIFDAYYNEIGTSDNYRAYEVESINDAITHYDALYTRLTHPKKDRIAKARRETLAQVSHYLGGKHQLARIAAQLGRTPGLPLNYLSGTKGRPLDSYAGPFREDILREHVNWEARIERALDKRFPPQP